MIFNVLTLFPEFIDGIKEHSIIKRAIEKGIVTINSINYRDYSSNKHKKVDDYPYGGGAGMLIGPQPIDTCIKDNDLDKDSFIIYMSPKGKTLSQKLVNELKLKDNLTIICGHYEGLDQRIIDKHVDMEVSIGDYVLTGGEIPAMVLIDSVARLIPDVLSKEESHQEESHSNHLLEHPHYTRPSVYEEMKVPEVLLSGNHKKIDQWRFEQSVIETYNKRPELIDSYMKDKNIDEKSKKTVIDILKTIANS
jgi:tRNA (guanine37-N1)-methyltransferase